MSPGIRRCCALSALLLALASSLDAQRAPAVTRTDSAGVSIATNSAPVSALRPVMTVAAEPRVRIGAVDGASEILFSQIRAAVRLADGRIAVANGDPTEIRIFSPTGTFLGKFGRRGQGPGEFQSLAALMPGGGDTILAVNAPRFQLLRFTGAGAYVGMATVSLDTVNARLAGTRPTEGPQELFRNGAFVISTQPDGEIPEEVMFPTGKLARRTTGAVWFSSDYARSRVIGSFGDIQQMFIDVGGGRRTPVIPPSARWPRHALGGGGTRLCLGADEGPELRCVDQDGSTLIVRWTQAPVPTEQKVIDDWKIETRRRATRGTTTQTISSGLQQLQMAERIIAAIVIPPTKPSIGSILVAADRRILVSGPDLQVPREGWVRRRVFSADGQLLGVADFPPIQVLEIGADYVLGVARDADGVEYVVVHDLRAGGE